jgi:uncharacterized protein (TIGR01244 family)
MSSFHVSSAIVTASLVVASAAVTAQVTKEQIPGVTNFARVETTVACAGAVKPEAIVEMKKMGFASVINLRLADEPGADIDVEAAAAKAAGINFIHSPFSTQSPDPAVVDTFLKAVTTRANEPAFIHCASGNRAAALWFIKRVQVDGWDQEKAAQEAAGLGLTNPALKQFAADYIQSHKK